jgi:hypothetical protein
MPKLLTKKGQDATDENYFIGGTVERLQRKAQSSLMGYCESAYRFMVLKKSVWDKSGFLRNFISIDNNELQNSLLVKPA